MHGHRTNGHDNHRWTFRSALHMVGAVPGLWSSDLSRTGIDLLNPQPGTTVLDLGAGLGPATVETAPRIGPGGRVIVVDPSSTMRRVLRMRRLWQRIRRVIDIRDGSAENLPIEGHSVDAAIAINAAHHFDDIELAAAEFARVLKPGGRLLLIDEDFTNPNHHWGDTEGPGTVDAKHFVDLLIAAGLAATRTEHQPIAGVTATVISATKPDNTEGSS